MSFQLQVGVARNVVVWVQPLKAKASIDENAKEWKAPMHFEANCLGGALWSLLIDLRQSQLAGIEELHSKVVKFWRYRLGLYLPPHGPHHEMTCFSLSRVY